jgi:hypothetical protein
MDSKLKRDYASPPNKSKYNNLPLGQHKSLKQQKKKKKKKLLPLPFLFYFFIELLINSWVSEHPHQFYYVRPFHIQVLDKEIETTTK